VKRQVNVFDFSAIDQMPLAINSRSCDEAETVADEIELLRESAKNKIAGGRGLFAGEDMYGQSSVVSFFHGMICSSSKQQLVINNSEKD